MSVREEMLELAVAAQRASRQMAVLSSGVKNELLLNMAAALEAAEDELQQENQKDLQAAREKGMAAAMVDRLALTPGADYGDGRWVA